MKDVFLRRIDGHHAVFIEFIAVSYHPEKLAAVARVNPSTGHCRAFRRTPAQERLDFLYTLFCHDGLPRIIADAVCKLIQDTANRQQGFLLAAACKQHHHDTGPSFPHN